MQEDGIVQLESALGKLSEEHRLVVMLHDCEGYKLTEIQDLTDIPVGHPQIQTAPRQSTVKRFSRNRWNQTSSLSVLGTRGRKPMNCNQTTEQLDDYLDGNLPTGDRVQFDQHLDQCAECLAVIKKGQMLQSRLVQYGATKIPMPDAGFYDRALARAARSGLRKQRNRWVMTGFSGAIAATLMIWMVSTVFFAAPQMERSTVPSVTMALEVPQNIQSCFFLLRDSNGCINDGCFAGRY